MKQQYWPSQDLPSALVLMDNVFSKLGSFKLSCSLPISDIFYRIIITSNHAHNVLRLFDILPMFLFTTSEAKRD